MVQGKCKPNAIKHALIAEVQPFLSKDTRNKIVEVKVDGLRNWLKKGKSLTKIRQRPLLICGKP